jgi:hypothetical protein
VLLSDLTEPFWNITLIFASNKPPLTDSSSESEILSGDASGLVLTEFSAWDFFGLSMIFVDVVGLAKRSLGS